VPKNLYNLISISEIRGVYKGVIIMIIIIIIKMKTKQNKKSRCQNCDRYEEIVSEDLCEGCFTSKQEQISAYGSYSEEVAW